ncbi:MAG: phytase [Phycisphaerae bacterium]|nr:phytase [Phycisphaerae bacterium]
MNSSTTRARLLGLCLVGCLLPSGCQQPEGLVVSPRAKAVSQPVPVNEVDDAAIWIHPSDPSKSLLLLANERRGLEVHHTDGLLLKHLDDGIRANNVDLVYEFPMGPATVDLAVASCLAPRFAGVKVWRIDPSQRKLFDVTAGSVIKVFDSGAPLGLCTYHSRKTGKSFFFVTSRAGGIEQYELSVAADGKIGARRVRAFGRPSKVEGCVADEERGVVYFSEEDTGVWRYPAEPDAPADGTCVIRVGEHGLISDVEGLALYCAAGGRGYLIVASQGPKGGHTCLKVYERQGDNRFVLTIDPSPEGFGKLERISGVAVTNQPTIPMFPRGLLAVNDNINPSASEDFKLYSWQDVARSGGLQIDTTWSPRPSRAK